MEATILQIRKVRVNFIAHNRLFLSMSVCTAQVSIKYVHLQNIQDRFKLARENSFSIRVLWSHKLRKHLNLMAAEGTTYEPKINYTEMVEVSVDWNCWTRNLTYGANFLQFKADQLLAIEIAVNALKTQEKSEKPIYHKDIAQIVKQQLDTSKG